MTLNQLEDLNEDELAMALVLINHIAPPAVPKMEFGPRDLTWFRHDMLIKKFMDCFNRLKPEGYVTYVSLMHKLGVCIQINQPEQPKLETSGSVS